MLVISRKIGETFLIGDNIEATVLDITGEKVVLGVSAPRELAITRFEADQTAGFNREAGMLSPGVNLHGFSKLYKSRLLNKRTPPKDPGAK